MIIKNIISSGFIKSIKIFYLIILIAGLNNVMAQNIVDSTKKVLFAAAHVKKESVYYIKQANVIFPEILKGNEILIGDYVVDYGNKNKSFVTGMYAKGKKILPKVNTILKQYNIPEELSMLMVLESECNANAVSRAGAVGYWQFMDASAKQYGMKISQKMHAADKKHLHHLSKAEATAFLNKRNNQSDDRRNCSKSTAAAARYLKDSQKALDNNWLLIVASYNCGLGRVLKAMHKTGLQDPDFWDIKKYLPRETRNYVMNFISLNVLYKNYENYLDNNLIFTSVKILLPENLTPSRTEVLSDNEGTVF